MTNAATEQREFIANPYMERVPGRTEQQGVFGDFGPTGAPTIRQDTKMLWDVSSGYNLTGANFVARVRLAPRHYPLQTDPFAIFAAVNVSRESQRDLALQFTGLSLAHAVVQLWPSNWGEQTEPQPEISEIMPGRRTGPVQFFAKLLEVWGLEDDDGAKLLGYEQVAYVRDLLSGAASLRTRDARDRVRYLLEIRAALDELFRDEAVERDWLREIRPELDSNSPLALLLEGSMENVLLVKQFVERISGR